MKQSSQIRELNGKNIWWKTILKGRMEMIPEDRLWKSADGAARGFNIVSPVYIPNQCVWVKQENHTCYRACESWEILGHHWHMSKWVSLGKSWGWYVLGWR